MTTATPRRQSAPFEWLARNWWVIPSCLGGLFTWLSFYIAGMRLHRRELIMIGTAYSAFSAMTWFAFTRHELDYSDTAGWLATIAVCIAWFGGMAHVGAVRAAYSRELAGRPATSGRGGRRRRNQEDAINPRFDGFGLTNPTGEYLAAAAPPDPGVVVEANTADAHELERLPGMTPELVDQWMAERTRRGGYRDLAELTRALDLAPHQVVRFRSRVSFEVPGPGRPPRSGRGRVLDV